MASPGNTTSGSPDTFGRAPVVEDFAAARPVLREIEGDGDAMGERPRLVHRGEGGVGQFGGWCDGDRCGGGGRVARDSVAAGGDGDHDWSGNVEVRRGAWRDDGRAVVGG